MSETEYQSIIDSHPGHYLKRLLNERGMSQEELSKRLDTTPKSVSELINGLVPLSVDMARRLSYVFDTTTAFWLNLLMTYEEKKQKIEKLMRLEKEIPALKMLNYSFWANMGLVKDTTIEIERVEELQRFFGVASLSVLKKKDYLIKFEENIDEQNVIARNAWLSTACKLAKGMDLAPYSNKGLKVSLQEIKGLASENLDSTIDRLREILRGNGVALVSLPKLDGSNILWATRWLNHDSVMIAFVDDLKSSDSFWFSLFFELGIVFQKKIKTISLILTSDREVSEKERRINEKAELFVKDMLPK